MAIPETQANSVENIDTRIAPSTAHKARYNSPVLTTYGSVNALTLGMGGTVPDFMGVAMMGLSERRFKENIARIGTDPRGFGLYLFDYLPPYRDTWGHGRRFGVMADEVARVVPEAVRLHADGYRVVDYAMLGIRIASREPESTS